MEHVPLVSVELQGVSAGFRDAARELGAARRVVSDAGVGSIGAPSSDPAVEAGFRDLAALLERLEATASACVLALSRYDDGSQP